MLKEFKNVSQDLEGKNKRRWFSDSSIELVVWFDNEGRELTGFQLCYDLQSTPHAFTWHRENNVLIHEKIDEGDTLPRKNLSPVMVSNGVPPFERVKKEFEGSSCQVEESIRNLVMTVLSKEIF